MRRAFYAILFLAIGAAAGSAAVLVYTRVGVRQNIPAGAPLAQSAAPKQKKILYYRGPMNPQETSPVPKKDAMGMDYVPVYEEATATAPQGAQAPGTVSISPEKIQKIGVKSEQAKRRSLKRVIRTVGRVEPVENLVYNINTKVPGWVEKLYLNRTDQMVHQGEPLLELYSPDLVSAQEEYVLAHRSYQELKGSPYQEVRSGAQSLLDAARKRLKYWDISDDQIKRLEETGRTTRTMVMRAPAHGSVAEKMVVEGQKIEAGEQLFRIIDHSSVWVYGEIYEYEIPYVKLGQTARLYPAYSTADVYTGRIEHIYSHIGSIKYEHEKHEKESEARTEKIRFELANTAQKLKLGMYMNVEISVDAGALSVTVPESAVIDTGTRQLVLIDRRDGTFAPREVRIGARAQGYFEVLQGVKEGDWVVTSANFLLDSESNLRAAIGGSFRPQGVAAPPDGATGGKEMPVEPHRGR